MRKIDYLEMGATLYVPATHKHLFNVVIDNIYPHLKSVVICLEDSIAEDEVQDAMIRVEELLKIYQRKELLVFLRPRNIENLKKILELKHIKRVDGFVLPKITVNNLPTYLHLLINKDFHLMPTLETIDVFNFNNLTIIRNMLDPFKDEIICIRVGGEDILNILHIRRTTTKTIYEYMPFNLIYSTIINIFKPCKYQVSAPVFNSFKESDILIKELAEDTALGIFNKTIINPSQIDIIHNAYKVLNNDYIIAKELLNTTQAIISYNGSMYEKSTHLNWAKNIIRRENIYGQI